MADLLIPSLAEISLGPVENRTLKRICLLAPALGVMALVSMFYQHHAVISKMDHTVDGELILEGAVASVHNGFADGVVGAVAILIIFVAMPLFTLMTRPQQAWPYVGILVALAFVIGSGLHLTGFEAHQERESLYYASQLPAGQFHEHCLAVLAGFALLGSFIRRLLHISARKRLLRRCELPLAVSLLQDE